jgi:hypothetical protein
MKKYAYVILLLTISSCQERSAPSKQASEKTILTPDTIGASIQARERASVKHGLPDSLGGLITTISLEVKTDNLKDYPQGIIPFAQLDHTEKDISKLVDKDKVVIRDTSIRIIIDYPLTNPYSFRLSSPTGFTKAILLKAISKHYYLLYEEEERTASIKTLPMKKRKMYNRNETNGKYGVWGHDIADLVLDEVIVYRADNGQITLTLEIES